MTGASDLTTKPLGIVPPPLAKAVQAAWLLLCLLLPISGNLVPVPLAITLVLVAATCWWVRPNVDWKALWPCFAWYFLHVLGMLWTTDVAFGLFDLQVKLGLVLLLPAGAAVLRLNPAILRHAMVAFTIGIGLSMVLGFQKAFACWASTGVPSCFAQSTLSYELHPSYAAWYACWAMAWWGYGLVKGHWGRRKSLLVGGVMMLLLVWIMLLASKSGVIGAALVVVWLVILGMRQLKGRARLVMLGSVAGAILIAVWAQGALVMARMHASKVALEQAFRGDPAIVSSVDGNDMRLVTWGCSIDRLEAEPWGSGTGDIKHALMGCYLAKNAIPAAEHNLNSHSQFLQGAVALGWPGLLLSLLLVLVPLVLAIQRRNGLLLVFLLLYVVNAAVDSTDRKSVV